MVRNELDEAVVEFASACHGGDEARAREVVRRLAKFAEDGSATEFEAAAVLGALRGEQTQRCGAGLVQLIEDEIDRWRGYYREHHTTKG